MKKEDLLTLIGDDDLGLLDMKPKNSNTISADERLIASFHEINQFYSENQREPEIGGDIHEHRLASRLKFIREDKEKMQALFDLDEHELLKQEAKEIKNVQDIFEDDDLGILDDQGDDIFELKHVPKKERESADYIARRKPCKNFQDYEEIFQNYQKDLKSGKRKLLDFNSEQQIQKGAIFVLHGMLVYIEDVRNILIDPYGKRDGRLRCIFENGTESSMLLRSLMKRLYEDEKGKQVSDLEESALNHFQGITDEDKETGYIYVLKSLSTNPEIQSIENLYKIGFSKIPVEERIKNAFQEPTYLMASVSLVSAYQCYNMNPQKFELLIHSFFGATCLEIDIFDNKGKRHTPREWFVVPLNVINEAINLIVSGKIINYRYDEKQEKIMLRVSKKSLQNKR